MDPGLCAAVVAYFDSKNENELEALKRSLIKKPETLETEILPHFHPTYEALKPLVRKWWMILYLGHRYHGDEFFNIHHHADDIRRREERRLRKQRVLDTFNSKPRTLARSPTQTPSLTDTPSAGHQAVSPTSSPAASMQPARKEQQAS
ncbi:hypothetical protein H0H87_008051 [Tephrocybe sp. NHM501043]|nr:hypothetical protein H0H87_008051 [Tephrocybe sp. NHM501043]